MKTTNTQFVFQPLPQRPFWAEKAISEKLILGRFHAAGLGLRDTSWIIIVNGKFPPCRLKNKTERTQYLIQNQPIKIYYSLDKPTKAQGLISVSIGKVILIYRLLSTWPGKIIPLAVIKSLERFIRERKLSPRMTSIGLRIIMACALVTSLRNFPRPLVY